MPYFTTTFDPERCPRTGEPCQVLENRRDEATTLDPNTVLQMLGEACKTGIYLHKQSSSPEQLECGLLYESIEEKVGK